MSWENLFDETDAQVKETKEYGVIKEGKYTGFFYEAKLNETKTPAQVSIKWRIVDADSEFKNRHVFANYTMNEKGIPFLKSDLYTLGVEQVTSKNLIKSLASLTGKEAEIYIKPKPVGDKVFYSVFVNELLTKNAPAFNMDEEIPF